MRQLSLRLAFLSLYALGTLAAARLPGHPPTAGTVVPVTASALIAGGDAAQNGADATTANAASERPRRAARIDFTMPYYRFGRLPMRL